MNRTAGRMLLAIPMKDPADAKTRLGVCLSPKERARLAIALFVNVVECVKIARLQVRYRHIDVAVITSSPTIRQLAKRLCVKCINDGGAGSLNRAISRAARRATAEGYASMCILPGDLADPSIRDLAQLLDYPSQAGDVVICPAKDMGTNALMVPLPSPIPFQYGERSFHRHYRTSVDADHMTIMLPLTTLRRDVDTLNDLRDLYRRRPDVAFWGDRR